MAEEKPKIEGADEDKLHQEKEVVAVLELADAI